MDTTEFRPKTFGIHFLKWLAILHQVMVHGNAWLTAFYPEQVRVAPTYAALQVMLIVGAISMIAPMTAAAILRLNVHVADDRIQNISWPPYLWLCGSLALLESCKQVWIYGWPGFFEWDALHTIALTIPLILLIGSYSIRLLWAVALGIIFSAPLLEWLVTDWELRFAQNHSDPNVFNSSSLSIAYLIVFVALWSLLFFKLLRSQLDQKRKILLSGVLCAAGALVAAFLEQISGTYASDMALRTLPIGILVGSREGYHIWGIFPWTGVIMLGFLVYDLMVRRPQMKWVLTMLLAGIAMIALFYWRYSDSTIANCAPRGNLNGFNGLCFNRTPQQLVLILGYFLLSAAEGRLMELWGWELPFMRAMSRSILWIYIFATTVLQNIAKWWIQIVPADQLIWSFMLLSLVLSHLLALVIDRAPTEIAITLKKTETVPS